MIRTIAIAFTFLFLLISNTNSQTTAPEWRTMPDMPEALHGHRSVLLPDGNILICGGINAAGDAVNSAYIYDNETGDYRKVASMANARAYHSLVAVPGDDEVSIFVIGGYSGNSGNYSSVRSVERVNYRNGQVNINWINVGNMDIGRGDLRAAWDKSGRIIISGGINQSSGALRSGNKIAGSEYIRIISNRIFSLPDMGKARSGHFLGAILDANDDNLVMTAGGEDGAVTTTELFENDQWSSHAFAPREYREYGSAFVDIAGIARVFGGYDENGTAQNTCEWYDVKSGWKYSASMFLPRADADHTLIAGIKDSSTSYLTAGGKNSGGALEAVEYYTLPTTSSPTGVWSQLGDLNEAGSGRETAINGNNLAMVFGGRDNSGNAMDGVEIFQPFSANDVTFGPEEVGRIADSIPVTITNEWLLPVKADKFRTDNSAEFFFTGDTTNFELSPGQSRQIYVWFRPSAQGDRNGYLKFNIGPLTDSVKLTGTGISSTIAVVTNSQDFGEIFVGSDTTVCFPAIKNTGTDTTYIDSISITPPGDYTVISPTGRVNIPPDSTLEVCIRFNPAKRGNVFGSVVVHIANGAYPSGLTGRGVLKYLSGYGPNGCDTINYEQGKTYQSSIILENPGDRPIRVTGFNFIGGNENLFAINRAFPFNIDVGNDEELFVDFTPVNEGTFRIDVEFEHDGDPDSTVIIPLCFVVRSKNVRFSMQEIDFGQICSGDSLTQALLIENPSNYETMTVDDLSKDDPSSPFIIPDVPDTVLASRQSLTVYVSMKSDVPGLFNDILEVSGSFGSVEIPVIAEILPKIMIEPSDDRYYYDPGEKFVISYEISGIEPTDPLSDIKLNLKYNSSVLYPVRVVEIAGASPLDQANSQISERNENAAIIDIAWQNGLVADGEAFGIEFEVLRGNSHHSSISVENEINENVCLSGENAEFFIESLCGGRNGLISTGSNAIFNVYPQPAGDELKVFLYDNENKKFNIDIFNLLGKKVYQKEISVNAESAVEEKINTAGFTQGAYIIRLRDDSGIIYDRIIIITK